MVDLGRFFGPSLVEIGGFRPKELSEPDEIWSILGDGRSRPPNLSACGPSSKDTDCIRPHVGQTRPGFGQMWVISTRRLDLGETRLSFRDLPERPFQNANGGKSKALEFPEDRSAARPGRNLAKAALPHFWRESDRRRTPSPTACACGTDGATNPPRRRRNRCGVPRSADRTRSANPPSEYTAGAPTHGPLSRLTCAWRADCPTGPTSRNRTGSCTRPRHCRPGARGHARTPTSAPSSPETPASRPGRARRSPAVPGAHACQTPTPASNAHIATHPPAPAMVEGCTTCRQKAAHNIATGAFGTEHTQKPIQALPGKAQLGCVWGPSMAGTQ